MSPAPVRTVLVTGAARRLGRVVALELARAGWQVAVHYRGSEADARQTASDCAQHAAADAFQADLADEAQVRGLLQHVADRFGGVDAVVNNASRFEHDSAHTFDFASLAAHMASNTAAPVLLAQLLSAHHAPQLRVVGVAPGLTLTSHLISQERFEELHKLSPLGRSSTPEDVAAAVRFALENRSITGTTLLVDGGQHLMKFERDFSLMTPTDPA